MSLVKVKRDSPDIPMPVQATEGSVGWDICAYTQSGAPYIIAPDDVCVLHTGLYLEVETTLWYMLAVRSGISCKNGLIMVNGVGIIDSDYRGELMVTVYNASNRTVVIGSGERIAQLIFSNVVPVVMTETQELSTTARGIGGFGSTGV